MGNTTRDRHIENYDAVEQPDGSWLHSSDGYVYWYNEEGYIHREDGPALIDNDGTIHWWLNGMYYSFAEWLIKLNKPEETKMLLKLRYA
jgi:hypothetical protein